MAQAKEPAIRIPFRYVSGIPRQAAVEIFRDFEEVLRHVNTGSASVYDAIIDPALAVSVPVSHLYVNFTELIAGEATSASHTIGFNIGVVPRATFQINEPGAISWTGWSHVNISSIAPAATEGISVGHAPFWNMPIVNMASGQIISMSGMHVPSGTGGFFGFAGSNIVLMNECWIGSGITCSPGSLYATDCFIGSQKVTGGSTSDDVILHDCVWSGAVNFGGVHSLHMLGGYLNGSLTTTGNIVGGFYMECAVQGTVQLNHVEGGVVHNLGSSNGTFFQLGSAVTGQCAVYGSWGEVWLAGKGIRADVRLNGVDGVTMLQLVGVTDSLITATFAPTGAGAQAYTIDAASARNVIVASGLHNAFFTVGSTNAGASNMVYDETGTTPAPIGSVLYLAATCR